MSQSHDNPKLATVPGQVESNEPVVEKQSLAKRGVNFVKTHKKVAIAVTALAGLVGVSAIAGRATAPSTDVYVPLELLAPDDELRDVEETTDTTVA